MNTILQGIPHVVCYFDDILITGSSDEEHLQNLEKEMKRLEYHGVRLRENKCSFFQQSVEYLGHHIDSTGLHTTEQKVEAIQLAPAPQDQTQLRSFLRLLHYYRNFMPKLSSLLHPMNELLKAGVRWKWSADCEKAFQKAKELLTSAPVLAHYDSKLPLRLAGDASAYGMGAVISHLYPDGSERPHCICFKDFHQK